MPALRTEGEDGVNELDEFLLARIAEDEDEWGNGAFAPVAGRGLSRLILKTRAECEVKRQIVNAWRSGFPDEDRYAMGWHDFHVRALCLLALPYADHPEYREEWRP